MARKPRIHFPGATYHVMLRGNGGQDIFFDSTDRTQFLLFLQQGLETYQCRVHAYCLMSNHVHLALQVAQIPLSKIMQNLGFRYTQYINRKQEKTGHLLQGRFKALLIDADSYLLELVRYIHLNPLRAGLVKDPGVYPWSSHDGYLGGKKNPWLTTDWVLSQFDAKLENARRYYEKFVQEGLSEGHREEFHCGSFEGRVLGDDSFVEQVLWKAEQITTRVVNIDAILEAVAEFYGIQREDLSSPGRHQPVAEARAVAAWLVKRVPHLQLKELGARLHRDLSGLSQAARRIEQRAKSDKGLRDSLGLVEGRANKSISQA